jgi:hypothetical protein
MDFEQALREQLEADPKRTLRARLLLEVLNRRPSKRRTWILNRLEAHAAAAAGVEDQVGIDWGAINWQKLFETILQILLAILPLLLAGRAR